ncbi:MAG: VWA domain-containing protein [Planctomycetes bacterium]|nr:VWA domain-containing protein [Planctomycetota bacterium]
MLRKMVVLGALALMIMLGWNAVANACGVIVIDDRQPRPIPNVNISVKNTSLDIKIEDQVAVATVDEIFHNSNPHQLEGTFILPILPETAVQDLALWINGKESKGELLDKDKALQYYQETVRRMVDPALLEYAGYGLLKLRVFPIPGANQDLGVGPGNVRIKYTYTYRLPMDNGLCEFRHPWGTNKFSSAAIDSAVIKVSLKSAIPIRTVYSPTYPDIAISRRDDRNILISFEQTKMKPDKDFVLYYSLSDKQFGVNLLTYKKASADGFFMMFLSPKYDLKDSEVVKKDVIFVLDTSGSMKDANKIEQAKKALEFCIRSLRKEDRFNLITFSADVRPFKDALQEVTPAAQDEAIKWVRDIEARGGTNIDDALQNALGMVDGASKRPCMVVFLTDGMPTIGEQNTDKILKNLAAKNTSNTRIFSFGVGYDINTHLLDKISEANKGAREYITPDENIEVKVSGFYDKIAYPVLADVKLEVSGIEIYDRYPKALPDVFRGSQLTIFGRYKDNGNKLITLSGLVNNEPRKFEYEATFCSGSEAMDFIPRLWAVTKIGYLLDEILLRGENKEVREEIIKLAKEYGILTPYTSWLVLEDYRLRVAALPPGAPPPPPSAPMDALKRGGGAMESEVKEKSDGADKISGAPAVSNRVANQRLQQGDYDQKKEGGKLGDTVRNNVRQQADRTFYQGNDNVWYDSAYDPKDAKKITEIKFMSDEYLELIKKEPRLARYLAVGQNVLVCWNDKIYQVR